VQRGRSVRQCNITFMMSAADPYHWSQSESKVTNVFPSWPIARMQLFTTFHHPMADQAVSFLFSTYEMQLAGAQVPLLRVAKTPTDKWLMMYHSFNATGEVVQLVIQPMLDISSKSEEARLLKGLVWLTDLQQLHLAVSSGNLHSTVLRMGQRVDEWRLLDSAKCQTAVARPAFKVNLFGSIGAGISFVPNTIDFGELFENWQGKLSESRAVLSVVIVLWVLFIPLAVLLRRMDLRDAQKFQFLPLKDEREQKGFVYKIEVFNGSKRGYEVPVGVFISVKGLNASELLRTLDDGERRNFESGGVDNFLMTTKAHLGDIRSICLTFDKTESGAGRWYVSRLIVTDCTNDNKYIFVIEDWLSPGIDSAVNCASSLDLKSQRTSYEVADSSSEAFRIGPVKVSYGSLITSILGALTVLPVSMATVLLFLKSKRQPQHIEAAQRYRPQSSRSRRVINSDAATTEDETEAEEEEKTWISKFSLPHWCQYVGWVLLVLSVLTAGVFIVFYAMDWGKEKSEGWLTVLLLQPLKVLAVGLVLALLMRKDYDSMDAHSVRVREIHDGRAISIGLNLAYLFLLYCVCYGSMDPVVFHLNNGLKMRLTVNQPSPQFSLDKVQKWEDIHTWLNHTVLPNLYPTVAANGQPLSEAEQKFIHLRWCWLSVGSREAETAQAVLLECSLFYPDTNFFTSVSILTELPPFGGALSSASLRSTSLYRYIGASGALRLCAELLAAAITLVLLLLQLRSCWLQGFSKHFSNPWNVSHLLTNLTMIAGLVFLLLRSFATVAALESMQNSNSGNLETVMFFDESFYYCLGIAMFLVQIGFLNLVRYSRSLAHLSGTLRNSLSELRSFFWVFLVIFLAFAFIANLVLGPWTESTAV
uniref:PLAT domain-containing protein n=1 Tax=Macrostomum lignano TaxID=282301 RepID=A0A1I8IV55_9PLAT